MLDLACVHVLHNLCTIYTSHDQIKTHFKCLSFKTKNYIFKTKSSALNRSTHSFKTSSTTNSDDKSLNKNSNTGIHISNEEHKKDQSFSKINKETNNPIIFISNLCFSIIKKEASIFAEIQLFKLQFSFQPKNIPKIMI